MATTNLGLAVIGQSDAVSPDPINANMEAIDKLGVDYITQQGKSGDWRYRRWKSGTFECWCIQKYQTPTSDTDGGDSKQYKVNYPVTFVEPPVLLVSSRQSNNNAIHTAYVEHDTSYAEWWVRGFQQTRDMECYLYAIGRVS
ncbi:hypothetical protein B5G20_04900 [Collinsella sp. An7]|uniref:hypothetical protein n=1 Tax=Collinsella sp. An7 TaxID=1965651 RepID=UPI000B3AB98B|nr:hypothetical protein [Collinsella sp. An7]OUN47306.1 hypothetical protein B5G20_04900 [Collinsella sp. An7]